MYIPCRIIDENPLLNSNEINLCKLLFKKYAKYKISLQKNIIYSFKYIYTIGKLTN